MWKFGNSQNFRKNSLKNKIFNNFFANELNSKRKDI